MKKLFFTLVLFTSFICLSGQNSSGDTLFFGSFSYKEMNLWDSIEKQWNQKYFNPFLKKNKIKISCGGCSRFIIKTYFEIDEKGAGHAKLLVAERCSGPIPKKQFNELSKLLQQIIFPAEFHNKKYKLSMGRVLKC